MSPVIIAAEEKQRPHAVCALCLRRPDERRMEEECGEDGSKSGFTRWNGVSVLFAMPRTISKPHHDHQRHHDDHQRHGQQHHLLGPHELSSNAGTRSPVLASLVCIVIVTVLAAVAQSTTPKNLQAMSIHVCLSVCLSVCMVCDCDERAWIGSDRIGHDMT